MDLKGSRTERNLLGSFAGESQARNRYTYYASQARKEGFVQIAKIFTETADQEKEHAKRFYKFLPGGEAEVSATFPAGPIGSTLENLLHAAAGEHEEWAELYPGFAEVAREEGFNAIAKAWEAICVSEKHHEERYRALARNVEAGLVFRREGKQIWYCQNCGYIHEGEEAPNACPACVHPKAHFALVPQNW